MRYTSCPCSSTAQIVHEETSLTGTMPEWQPPSEMGETIATQACLKRGLLLSDLVNFKKGLVGEIKELIARQHEALLPMLVSQLSDQLPDVQTNAREREKLGDVEAPAQMSEATEVDLQISEAKSSHQSDEVELLISQADDHNLHGGCCSKQSTVRRGLTSASAEAACEEFEDIDLRVDGAFGAIFLKHDSDLEVPHYHVEQLYSTTGIWQAVARSETFINVTLGVISLNAIWIGIDADWNNSDSLYGAQWPFVLMENLFCFYFTFEWVFRFMAFRDRGRGCWIDGWFKFDTCLVLLMVGETWILGPILALKGGAQPGLPTEPLRLLRLSRLTRMARLMRSLPELVTMTKGMVTASRAVCSSLLMLLIMIYTFAIIINMGMKSEDEINNTLAPRNFASLLRTMFTLLMDGTFMDNTGDVLSQMIFSGRPIPILCCIVFMTFILFSAVTVMNMLIGVLCEVVSQVAQREKDEAAVKLVKDSILMHLKKCDNGDGMISSHELMSVMKDPQSKAVLRGLNVDRLFLLELQSMLYPTADSQVPIRGIMELLLMCRGDLPVTVQHMASAQACMISIIDKFEQRMDQRLSSLEKRA